MYADDTGLYCNISQNTGESFINAELWDWLRAITKYCQNKIYGVSYKQENVIYPKLKVNISNIE